MTKLGLMIAIVGTVLLIAGVSLNMVDKAYSEVTGFLRPIVLVLVLFIWAVATGVWMAESEPKQKDNKVNLPTEMPPHE